MMSVSAVGSRDSTHSRTGNCIIISLFDALFGIAVFYCTITTLLLLASCVLMSS